MKLLSIPTRLWTLTRNQGFAKVLFHYLPKILLWKYNTFRVRRSYFQGQRKYGTGPCGDDEMDFVRDIVQRGQELVMETNRQHLGALSSRTDLRFLFHTQSAGAGRYFFLDLADCLEHMGISVRHYDSSLESLGTILSSYRPSVFMSHDNPYSMEMLDFDALKRYKESNPLARLIVPTLESNPSRFFRSLSDFDRRRISLSTGKLADAYFCYLEEPYWCLFCQPWADTGKKFLSIPFAVNPIRHCPVAVPRCYDWALATANFDLGVRASLTNWYMKHVMRHYSGKIVGHGWGSGIVPIPSDDISDFFMRARVAPNFASDLNMRYPLDCGGKVHELLAIGVFQIASERRILRQYYEMNEVVGCENQSDFEALFEYFVHKPEVRHMYVVNGQKRALIENTYFERIRPLVDFLDGNPDFFS